MIKTRTIDLNPRAVIPKSLGNAGFRVQVESQSKAQLAVND